MPMAESESGNLQKQNNAGGDSNSFNSACGGQASSGGSRVDVGSLTALRANKVQLPETQFAPHRFEFLASFSQLGNPQRQ